MSKVKTVTMKINLLRLFGALITAIGLAMIVGFGMAASKGIQNTDVPPESVSEEYESEYSEAEPVGLSDNKWLMKSHILFFGAFLVLSGTSCFYVPCTDKTVVIFKKKYDEDEEEDTENLEDDEFDYPDDDFDYILDEEIRQRMIELRNEKIKEKRRKNRRFRIR